MGICGRINPVAWLQLRVETGMTHSDILVRQLSQAVSTLNTMLVLIPSSTTGLSLSCYQKMSQAYPRRQPTLNGSLVRILSPTEGRPYLRHKLVGEEQNTRTNPERFHTTYFAYTDTENFL